MNRPIVRPGGIYYRFRRSQDSTQVDLLAGQVILNSSGLLLAEIECRMSNVDCASQRTRNKYIENNKTLRKETLNYLKVMTIYSQRKPIIATATIAVGIYSRP